MEAKEQARWLHERFDYEVEGYWQAKKCAIVALDFMIEQMNNYSDLESHLYKTGFGTTTIVAEIICLETIKKEIEAL